MPTQHQFNAVILGLCVMCVSLLSAQEEQPWLRPGERVGEQIIGPDGGKMVWVPPGEFMMGSADGAADEQPVHRVQISRGFWLSRCEMTVAQWKNYCQQAGLPQSKDIFSPDDHPMSGVSWYEVRDYCRFYGLTLPTEAQWEWAARGPEERRYPWGNHWNPLLCCNRENPAPPADDLGISFTTAVGSFPKGASWCGALDMAGNLSEWCADWYAEDYYHTSPEVDPAGPEQGMKKVWRGGYCWGDAEECLSTKRFDSAPDNDGGAGCLRACFVP